MALARNLLSLEEVFIGFASFYSYHDPDEGVFPSQIALYFKKNPAAITRV